MDEVVETYLRDNTFMGAVLVARGGEVILSKGYGSANLEWNIPNTPATKFRLGSITKQFTAASILLLEERGKLTLDDQLTTQLTGQPQLPMFAETETKFFLKVVDAQVEFFTDATGAVTHAVMYQNGRERKVPRTSDSVAPPKLPE